MRNLIIVLPGVKLTTQLNFLFQKLPCMSKWIAKEACSLILSFHPPPDSVHYVQPNELLPELVSLLWSQFSLQVMLSGNSSFSLHFSNMISPNMLSFFSNSHFTSSSWVSSQSTPLPGGCMDGCYFLPSKLTFLKNFLIGINHSIHYH